MKIPKEKFGSLKDILDAGMELEDFLLTLNLRIQRKLLLGKDLTSEKLLIEMIKKRICKKNDT